MSLKLSLKDLIRSFISYLVGHNWFQAPQMLNPLLNPSPEVVVNLVSNILMTSTCNFIANSSSFNELSAVCIEYYH